MTLLRLVGFLCLSYLRRLEKVTLFRSVAFLLLGYVAVGLGIQWPLSEPDRLSGPVKSIVWRGVTVEWKQGKFLESEGYLIKTAEYDARGRELQASIGTNVCVDRCARLGRYLDFVFWPFTLSSALSTRRSYDSAGKLIQIEKDDQSIPKWIYRYEYDTHGNWIKRTSLMRESSLEGYSSFAPREIQYRRIAYFGEER